MLSDEYLQDTFADEARNPSDLTDGAGGGCPVLNFGDFRKLAHDAYRKGAEDMRERAACAAAELLAGTPLVGGVLAYIRALPIDPEHKEAGESP